MGDIQALTEIDLTNLFLTVFIVIIGINKIIEVIGKFAQNIGKPIKWLKVRNSDHELILENSKAIKDLAEIHKHDNEISNEHDEKLRADFEDFMTDIKYKFEQMAYDRINDREKSREIRADLVSTIKIIAEANEKNSQQIKELTDLFVDKEINDYRWEIINVADEISNGKFVSKERLKHAIATHSKYEEIIEKYNLTNGEVEISIEVINEAYKKKLLEKVN